MEMKADIIWVKNRSGSWWPAQVVDENLISKNRKPSKRSSGKVLVRLYGTRTYSYVDPVKWRSEFDTILEQNNGSCRELLLKAMEGDIARIRAGESKRKISKYDDKSRQAKKDSDEKKLTKFNKGCGEKRKKTSDTERDEVEVLKERSNADSCGKSRVLSTRRLKVMQSLGLAAPPGSPFCKH